MTTTRVFRGEGDLMVDALIAASQAKPSDNGPQMPGFGRDLVPFFDTDGNENTYGLASGTPPQGPEFTYEYQQPVMAQQNANGGGKKSKKKPPQPAQAQKKVPAPKAVLQRGQQLPVPLANGQPKADNKARPASGNAKPGEKDVPNRWAGPAFGNSPAPNALPVPTPSWVARRRRRCLRARQRMRVTPSCRCSGSHRRPARKCLRCTRHPPPTSWPCSRSPSSPITVPLFCPPQSGPRRWRTRRDLRRSCSRLSFSPRWWPSRTEARRPRRCRAIEARG